LKRKLDLKEIHLHNGLGLCKPLLHGMGKKREKRAGDQRKQEKKGEKKLLIFLSFFLVFLGTSW
jgi:hypothetical protein